MKRVLVLSGGGAKIGFQVGVFHHLKNKQFDAVFGTSCGSIWAAMVAQNKADQAKHLILSLDNTDIYKGNLSVGNIIKKLILGKNYLLDMSPLRGLLTKFVKKADFVIPAYFCYVDFTTGELITKCSSDCETDSEIVDAIMASCMIPIAMPPVGNFVDGGVLAVCPLSEAIKFQPSEIVIINCFNRASRARAKGSKLLQLASWLFIESMPETIARNSVDTFLIINQILKAVPRQELQFLMDGQYRNMRYFDYQLYEPQEDLGDTIDFSEGAMFKRFCHGRTMAWSNYLNK